MEDPKKATTTEMVAPVKASRMVKIKALRAIMIDQKAGTMLGEGQTADVPEEVAAEFCDRVFTGNYAFGGERMHDTPRNQYRRAERVKTEAPRA